MSNPKSIERVTYDMIERKVGDLWVDPNVQRSLRKARVTRMAGDFRRDALGVLTTSFRSPKRIHIIDGQHRYRAAEQAAYTGTIQTMGISRADRARRGRTVPAAHTTEKVSRIDQFLISCIEEDPASVAAGGVPRRPRLVRRRLGHRGPAVRHRLPGARVRAASRGG